MHFRQKNRKRIEKVRREWKNRICKIIYNFFCIFIFRQNNLRFYINGVVATSSQIEQLKKLVGLTIYLFITIELGLKDENSFL